jgi:peptide/nickel transport system substrate-binding protein
MIRTIALVAVLAGPVFAESRPEYGGELIGSLYGEPVAIDPSAARSHAEIAVVGLIYDTLYRVDSDGAIVPHLALAGTVTDGKTARLRIRPGVELHDGSVLSAADVATSLLRLRDTASGWILSGVDAIAAEGDAVVFSLAHGDVGLQSRLALPQTAIVGRSRLPSNVLAGTGAFSAIELDRKKKRLTLRAFERHFAGRPYVDQIALSWFVTGDAEARRFETGGAHFSIRGATVFANQVPKYKARDVEGPSTIVVHAGFGRAHPAVTGNRDFRRALSLALARNTFTPITTGETVVPAAIPIPTLHGALPATATERAGDVDAAVAALRTAALAVPDLAPPRIASLVLEIVIDTSRPDDREVAGRLVRGLDKLGIASTITALGATEFADRVARGACDLYVGSLAMPMFQQDLAWAMAFEAGGDTWVRAQLAKGPLDLAAAQAAFAGRLPIVPLFHRSIRVAHRTDVRNIAFDGAGRIALADAFFFGRPERAKKGATGAP